MYQNAANEVVFCGQVFAVLEKLQPGAFTLENVIQAWNAQHSSGDYEFLRAGLVAERPAGEGLPSKELKEEIRSYLAAFHLDEAALAKELGCDQQDVVSVLAEASSIHSADEQIDKLVYFTRFVFAAYMGEHPVFLPDTL